MNPTNQVDHDLRCRTLAWRNNNVVVRWKTFRASSACLWSTTYI